MNVMQRLMLQVVLTLACIIAVVSIATVDIGAVFTATNYGNENSVPSLQKFYDIRSQIAAVRLVTPNYIVDAGDASALAEHEKKLAAARAALAKDFDEYSSKLVSDDKDQHYLEQLVALTKQYETSQDNLIGLVKKNQVDLALAQARGEMAIQADKIMGALAEQVAYNASLAQRGSDDAQQKKRSALFTLIAATVAIALFAIIMGIFIARKITRPLGKVVEVADSIASGNLAVQVNVGTGRDEISLLNSSIYKMVEQLRNTIGEVVGGAHTITSLSSELSSTAHQVSASTHTQAASTSSAAAAVEQLTVSIDHVGTSSDEANEHAGNADQMAVAGTEEMNSTSRRVEEVAGKVDESAKQIQALSDQIQQIDNITTVIREVADQTNLLALNAAIEAARAGEQGRGFAVVADEVRKLAERTTTSVQEITSMINAIQTGATNAVASMRESRGVVADIVGVAAITSKRMNDIRAAAGVVQQSIGEISSAMQEQRSASQDLANNVQSIASMSEENSRAVESVAVSAETLMGVAGKLQASVGRFRL